MQIIIDGKVKGGGGGGGGGTQWNGEWNTVYRRDFAQLADADILAGGDGARSIDGLSWNARNTAQMTSLDVGATAGGLKMGLGSTALEYVDATKTAAAMELDIAQVLAGTDYENRNDIELRVTAKTSYEGAFSTTPTFEHLGLYLQAKTHDANRRIIVLRGSESSNAGRRRCWFFGLLGSLVGNFGKQDWSNTDLAYFPNVVRLSMLENFSMGEFSAAADSGIGDAMLHGYTAATTAANLLAKTASVANTLQFAFARRNAASAQLTAYILEELLVEARFSPRGIGAFAPAGA